MKIALDVDGVLADFSGSLIERINEIHGKSFKVADITQYDTAKALGIEQSAINDIVAKPGFCTSILTLPGARRGYDRICHLDEVDVYFVTSPFDLSKTWAYERMWWLRSTFFVDPKRIIHTQAKHMVDADVLIDDNPEIVDEWVKERGRPAVLWDQPWNRSHQPVLGVTRLDHTDPNVRWNDLLGFLKDLQTVEVW